MAILSLSLFNFRNFLTQKIVFDSNLTVIVGPNGSGKSNILEAVSMLATSRLRSVESDLDLVNFGKSEAKIEGVVQRALPGGEKVVLTINFQVIDERYVKKSYMVNSLKKRLIDFINYFSIITFSPLDLELVDGAPSGRRHHLDILLSSVDKEYWRNISAYNKIVIRRNRVLQRIGEEKSQKSELDFWDLRLLEHAKYISEKRREFFEFLNSTQSRVGQSLGHLTTHAFNVFSWQLKQSLLSEQKLLVNRERDIAVGMTLSGPHRDDFRFLFDGRQPGGASGSEGHDLEFFGSRGEQRMAVLALKLAELEYVAQSRGSRPLLALDDIFSELDWEHRQTVLSVIGKQQTIITAAEVDSIPKEILSKGKVVELR